MTYMFKIDVHGYIKESCWHQNVYVSIYVFKQNLSASHLDTLANAAMMEQDESIKNKVCHVMFV